MKRKRNGMTRSEMVEWLVNAISAEVEKPFEEIDYDFVAECANLLIELDYLDNPDCGKNSENKAE